jgi:hypothetical protein
VETGAARRYAIAEKDHIRLQALTIAQKYQVLDCSHQLQLNEYPSGFLRISGCRCNEVSQKSHYILE